MKKFLFAPLILILLTGCQTKLEFCNRRQSALDYGFVPDNKIQMKRLGISGYKNVSDYEASRKVNGYCSYLRKNGDVGGWIFK